MTGSTQIRALESWSHARFVCGPCGRDVGFVASPPGPGQWARGRSEPERPPRHASLLPGAIRTAAGGTGAAQPQRLRGAAHVPVEAPARGGSGISTSSASSPRAARRRRPPRGRSARSSARMTSPVHMRPPARRRARARAFPAGVGCICRSASGRSRGSARYRAADRARKCIASAGCLGGHAARVDLDGVEPIESPPGTAPRPLPCGCRRWSRRSPARPRASCDSTRRWNSPVCGTAAAACCEGGCCRSRPGRACLVGELE